MKIGLLWFDNSDKPLSVKLQGAIAYYEQRFGRKPDHAYVHPKTEIDSDCKGIEIEKSRSVMPNHIWLGMGD